MVHADPTLRALLSYTTIDQIMQRSIRDIRKWIKHSAADIHAHQEGAKQRALLSTNDICSYFQPQAHPPSSQTPNKKLLLPPLLTPNYHKDRAQLLFATGYAMALMITL